MLTKLLRPTLWLALLAVGLALAADLAYFAHGSLDLFPTDEQQDTVRQVTGAIGVLLAAVEFGLWSLLRRLGPARAEPTHAG
ncbi:MAG TPA: hypothetical protein VE913_24080 [Longimicrobium sp.]|nr:hypothetical protein [Longimicrobium sp.]